MPTKASKNVYRNNSKIISGVIAVLATASEPLSLQELVDEMKRRHLVIFHGSTPRNTVSGEISKLLNAVGPNNAPILKVNQGKLTKFFLRPHLQQEKDGLNQVSNGKVQKKPSPRITRHSCRSSPSISSASFSSSSSSDEQTTNRILGQKKRRTMEDLKAAYLLSCLSAHSFWLNYKNEPEKDFEYFVASHLGTQAPIGQTNVSDGDISENASSDTSSSSGVGKEYYAAY